MSNNKRKPPSRAFGSAAISPCGIYRYELTRSWDATRPLIAFVMLNPSTADAVEDDPTIRRCIGFADGWGFGEVRVYNLFALRTPDPEHLWKHEDPFGPDFEKYAAKPRECEKIVVAWGSFGDKGKNAARGRCYVGEHLDGCELWALALNADGSPRHPLYVRADQRLTRWESVR
jgi:hypothetical protein